MDDHEWKDICLQYARSLVDVLDGVQDHDIQTITGLPEDSCRRIAKDREEAKELLEYFNMQ